MIRAEINVLPYRGAKSQFSSWICEAIWGHRLERQPVSALLLEFLSIAEGLCRKQQLLQHGCEDVVYTPYLCTQLRNILFNNPMIDEIASGLENDDDAWARWLDEMHTSAVANRTDLRNYEYLRKRFESFDSFASIVSLLRRTAMDTHSNRGWTYRLLYPIGPYAIFDEATLKPDKSGFSTSRVLFTRTGELAYLMLSRSREEVRHRIAQHLSCAFDPELPSNRLLRRLLSTPQPDTFTEKHGTYLPYKDHPAFDRMAEDVLALFDLGLPSSDVFSHLGPVMALHLLLYQLETANALVGTEELPCIVCEILAPRACLVRRAALASITDNESLGMQAVRNFVCDQLDGDAELHQVLSRTDLDAATKSAVFRDRAKELFNLKNELGTHGVNEQRDELLGIAQSSYRDTVGDAVRSLADQCGLRSRQRTVSYRYCPSDDLLRNLVYVRVTRPAKESDFLQDLYHRYRLVIGPEEARIAGIPEELFDKAEYERNRERLLLRLMRMGLARRMSDSFTYVVNPIAENNGH